MANLINFLNSFMSYIVLMVIILAVGGIATTLGITAAKRKNAKTAEENE